MAKGEDYGRLTRLERQVQEIAARVAALETAGGAVAPVRGPEQAPLVPAGTDREDAVLAYSGEGRFGPHRLVIRGRTSLTAVMGADPDALAPVFTAMASPVRLVVLRALVGGARNVQQLRELLDVGSAGQLYHHLRELLAAGLVTQPARSVYAIPREKVVAICIALTAAVHLAPASLHTPLPPVVPEPEEPPGEQERPNPPMPPHGEDL